jgi:hypothetical protein
MDKLQSPKKIEITEGESNTKPDIKKLLENISILLSKEKGVVIVAVVGILIISSIIIAIDVPQLVRKKRKKEPWIFSTLLLFGTALSIALALGANIPNPMDFIFWIFKPFSEFIGRLG